MKKGLLITLTTVVCLYWNGQIAHSADAERVDVNKIKKKYWARGDKSRLGVVQNRTFSKAGKWSLGAFGGFVISDPFLTINNGGVSVGYHFDENYSLSLVGWKHFVRDSDAHTKLKEERNATTNTNEPSHYFGLEPSFSFLYGKLSLVGKKIIYYDMHFSGGLGLTKTESGSYFTPSVGLGQRFYMSKKTSLRIDYRLLYYKEDIVEKQIVTKIGDKVGSRNNFSSVITIGVDFLFGGGGKK